MPDLILTSWMETNYHQPNVPVAPPGLAITATNSHNVSCKMEINS